MAEPIDHRALVKLVEAGNLRSTRVVGKAGGWGITVTYGREASPLAAQRGSTRIFSKLDTVVTYLKRIGIDRFEVDVLDHDPASRRRARPDRSRALKHAHRTAAYDTWFREQVRAAIEDTRPSISHEEMSERWKKRRTELLAKARLKAKA